MGQESFMEMEFELGTEGKGRKRAGRERIPGGGGQEAAWAGTGRHRDDRACLESGGGLAGGGVVVPYGGCGGTEEGDVNEETGQEGKG